MKIIKNKQTNGQKQKYNKKQVLSHSQNYGILNL